MDAIQSERSVVDLHPRPNLHVLTIAHPACGRAASAKVAGNIIRGRTPSAGPKSLSLSFDVLAAAPCDHIPSRAGSCGADEGRNDPEVRID
jgi:hypothetical protein